MTLHICHGRQPFFRCQPRHYHCGHGGGNNYGTIFNVTNNCCGGHTSGWNSFLTGAGYGLTNWLSGFMGMGGFGMNMMNPWAGMFQMAAPFGFQGNGWWNTSGGSDKSEESSKDYDKYAGDKNAGNADTPELRRLTDKFNTLEKHGTKGEKLNSDLVELKDELKKLIDKPKDEANIDDDKKLYKDLLNRIIAYEKTLNEIPVSHKVESDKNEKKHLENQGDLDAKKVTVNRKNYDGSLPNKTNMGNFNDFTENDFDDLKANRVVAAWDIPGSEQTPPVRNVDGNTCDVEDKDGIIQIKLKDGSLDVTYEFQGKSGNKYVFKDMTTKHGEQLYLLQYKLNGDKKEFYLMQYDGMSGANLKAHSRN
ncbi:hypothetical protein J6R97_01680 [bacterium]|nr:hypothetical protein [bacterium]